MRNKSCGNGSKYCVAFRNVMRNRIAIGNPTLTLLHPATPLLSQVNHKLRKQHGDCKKNKFVSYHDMIQSNGNKNLLLLEIKGILLLNKKFTQRSLQEV